MSDLVLSDHYLEAACTSLLTDSMQLRSLRLHPLPTLHSLTGVHLEVEHYAAILDVAIEALSDAFGVTAGNIASIMSDSTECDALLASHFTVSPPKQIAQNAR